MISNMQTFRGAVLFLDMLGFSALTRGQLTLGETECTPWDVDPEGKAPHQSLAANILVQFRNTLVKTRRRFSAVKVTQLSDCAFLWSTDVGALVDAGQYAMYEAITAGLLCRGGLAFGDFYEPRKVNQSLGAFIVGDAVTRAASFESLGKGARVFTDTDTAREVWKARPEQMFEALINPLNGEAVDEWQWYGRLCTHRIDEALVPSEFERLVKCYSVLRHSRKLAWCASTLEGRRQIACSVSAMAQVMEKLSNRTKLFETSVETMLEPHERLHEPVRLRAEGQMLGDWMLAIQQQLAGNPRVEHWKRVQAGTAMPIG